MQSLASSHEQEQPCTACIWAQSAFATQDGSTKRLPDTLIRPGSRLLENLEEQQHSPKTDPESVQNTFGTQA